MPEQRGVTPPRALPASGLEGLDKALQQLIDIDGRAIAVAKRVEQEINARGVSPELRQKLIDGMDRIVASSDNVHHFVAETLAPVLTQKTAEASTETAPKRRKPRNPRVHL